MASCKIQGSRNKARHSINGSFSHWKRRSIISCHTHSFCVMHRSFVCYVRKNPWRLHQSPKKEGQRKVKRIGNEDVRFESRQVVEFRKGRHDWWDTAD